MTVHSFGASHRSIANKMVWKTLVIGLGGSALLHTAAIAGVSYLSQSDISDLEITEIERVEIDPVPTPSTQPLASVAKPIPIPSTKLIAPIAKPIPAPKPKVVEPIVAAIPIPKPVAIPIPEVIKTPVPVVKITKATVPVKLPTALIAKAVSPQPNRVATTVAPVKDKDITNKTDRSQPQTATPNQSKITNNKAAFGNTSLPSSPLLPSTSSETLNNNPNGDESTPRQPGNSEKLARATEKSPISNNQTSLTSSNNHSNNRSLQGLGKDADPTGSNSPINDDSGSSVLPGNNARIANNSSTTIAGGSSSNQTGLGGVRSNSPKFGDGFNGGGDSSNGGGSDFASGGPGNNTRIARSNSGGTGGGRRQGSQFGSLDGTGNGDTYSNTNGNDELGNGSPGNIATGGNNQLSIQCLSNCDIRYPDSLEASDTGKDKILVKVTINANGRITNAQIVRSSGNQKLDSFTLNGVKQMQLTAMGKPLTFKIRVSALTTN